MKLTATLQLLLVAALLVEESAGSRAQARAEAEDESIQQFVLRRAQRLGYGLRIIPRVKELIFGTSSKSKPSAAKANSISKSREKRKLIRRPPRVTSHATKNQKAPRKVFRATKTMFRSKL